MYNYKLTEWLRSFSDLDRSRSIWICQTRSIQSGEKERTDHYGRKSDFLRSVGAVQILIENAERFARIDLDRSRSEKERNHYIY